MCFTSDHGDMMGDHGMWRKGYPYRGSAHVPLFLYGPGIPVGERIEESLSDRDIDVLQRAPTARNPRPHSATR